MEDYLKNRSELQRMWYEKRANDNKRRFISYQTVIIILGAVIPVVVVLESVIPILEVYGGVVTAIISAVIAVYAGLDKLKQPQPNWFNYRTNEEMIKKEEWLFKYLAGPYKGLTKHEAEIVFVERVESIISSDIARTTNHKQDEKKEEKK